MKERTAHRPYRQRRRAEAAEANTERILQAAHQLFEERPWDQITFATIAERAGVGTQTIIRRFGTKDGLARAVNEWAAPQIRAARDVPVGAPPAEVAAALAATTSAGARARPHAAPAGRVARAGRGGRRRPRRAPRVGRARVPPSAPPDTFCRLIGVCGIELWLVLRRDAGLSLGAARSAVADLIAATLPDPHGVHHGSHPRLRLARRRAPVPARPRPAGAPAPRPPRPRPHRRAADRRRARRRPRRLARRPRHRGDRGQRLRRGQGHRQAPQGPRTCCSARPAGARRPRARDRRHRPRPDPHRLARYGATVAAEASGRPWAYVLPSLLPLPGKGIPPYGLAHEADGRAARTRPATRSLEADRAPVRALDAPAAQRPARRRRPAPRSARRSSTCSAPTA